MLTIRLPPDLVQRADQRASARDMTRSQAIRRWIENGVMEKWHPGRLRPKAASNKASDLAGQEIDRLTDQSASPEEQDRRKRRLVKGPSEFRDIRSHPKTKS